MTMAPTTKGSTPPATPTAKRGILYVKWREANRPPNETIIERSIASVRQHHPELPIHIHQLPDNSSLLDKAGLFAFSPFEETLFLDLDTVVLDRLDFGFEMGVKHGLACSICECPWARRYGGIKGDLVEYNTGVLFFTAKGKPIFDLWEKHARTVDSSIKFYRQVPGQQQPQLVVMPYNDQGGFAVAIAESPVTPFILPYNWNFRPAWHRSWWGPIKVWHDYNPPPQEIVNFSRDQAKPESIIQFLRFQ